MVLNYEKQLKEGTCKVSVRSVIFSAYYADFCLCPKSVIITTLSSRNIGHMTVFVFFAHTLLTVAYIQFIYHITFNQFYTGGLFHCYMLDESICHFRGVGFFLWHLFFFWWTVVCLIVMIGALRAKIGVIFRSLNFVNECLAS